MHRQDAEVPTPGTCECRRMGGLSGKESQAAQWVALAALAAHVTGRPAKCRLDRDEDMIMTGKRHDVRVDYKIGYDDSARLTAVDVDFLARCGYSADLSQGVCDRTMFHCDNAYFYPVIISIAEIPPIRFQYGFPWFRRAAGHVFAER